METAFSVPIAVVTRREDCTMTLPDPFNRRVATYDVNTQSSAETLIDGHRVINVVASPTSSFPFRR
jgi:hypothetical protein